MASPASICTKDIFPMAESAEDLPDSPKIYFDEFDPKTTRFTVNNEDLAIKTTNGCLFFRTALLAPDEAKDFRDWLDREYAEAE